MDVHTTQPDLANPFADTLDDPRELQRLIAAALEKATQRRANELAPRLYWEEPGLHGSKREIDLRSKLRAAPSETRAKVLKALPYRLPPLPKRKRMSGGTIALISVGVLGAGLLAAYLVRRRKQQLASGTHVGDDVCGFDLLGVGP